MEMASLANIVDWGILFLIGAWICVAAFGAILLGAIFIGFWGKDE